MNDKNVCMNECGEVTLLTFSMLSLRLFLGDRDLDLLSSLVSRKTKLKFQRTII